MQSVPITTNVVSSNLVHGEVYSIQYYLIKFVSDLRQVGGFLCTLVSSTNKTDRYDIIEILLKVDLSTINHTQTNPSFSSSLLVRIQRRKSGCASMMLSNSIIVKKKEKLLLQLNVVLERINEGVHVIEQCILNT